MQVSVQQRMMRHDWMNLVAPVKRKLKTKPRKPNMASRIMAMCIAMRMDRRRTKKAA
jgi:hypothetical protein